MKINFLMHLLYSNILFVFISFTFIQCIFLKSITCKTEIEIYRKSFYF